MYFAAKALLLKKDITVKTHKGLLSKFGLEFVNEGVVEEYYGRALRIAEELRETLQEFVKSNLKGRPDPAFYPERNKTSKMRVEYMEKMHQLYTILNK